MKYVILIVLIVGFALFASQDITGQATRNKVVMKSYPGCKSGCYYGSTMGIRENGQITLVSKKDFHFQCREPEKTGCLPEGTTLYPTTFKGDYVHGIYQCVNHFWEFNSDAMTISCPPQLAILD